MSTVNIPVFNLTKDYDVLRTKVRDISEKVVIYCNKDVAYYLADKFELSENKLSYRVDGGTHTVELNYLCYSDMIRALEELPSFIEEVQQVIVNKQKDAKEVQAKADIIISQCIQKMKNTRK